MSPRGRQPRSGPGTEERQFREPDAGDPIPTEDDPRAPRGSGVLEPHEVHHWHFHWDRMLLPGWHRKPKHGADAAPQPEDAELDEESNPPPGTLREKVQPLLAERREEARRRAEARRLAEKRSEAARRTAAQKAAKARRAAAQQAARAQKEAAHQAVVARRADEARRKSEERAAEVYQRSEARASRSAARIESARARSEERALEKTRRGEATRIAAEERRVARRQAAAEKAEARRLTSEQRAVQRSERAEERRAAREEKAGRGAEIASQRAEARAEAAAQRTETRAEAAAQRAETRAEAAAQRAEALERASETRAAEKIRRAEARAERRQRQAAARSHRRRVRQELFAQRRSALAQRRRNAGERRAASRTAARERRIAIAKEKAAADLERRRRLAVEAQQEAAARQVLAALAAETVEDQEEDAEPEVVAAPVDRAAPSPTAATASEELPPAASYRISGRLLDALESVAEAPASAPEPAPPRTPSRWWAEVLATLLHLLVVLAIVVPSFVLYELWGTTFAAARSQSSLTASFNAEVRADALSARLPGHPAPRGGTLAAPGSSRPIPGTPLAQIFIPDIGERLIVVQGVTSRYLRTGPGHYPGTAAPGEAGNVVIAGHRVTYLHPFYYLDQLRPGYRIVLSTPLHQIVYRVTRVISVRPSDASVLAPSREDLLTLTTASPVDSASARLVVVARLSSVDSIAISSFTPGKGRVVRSLSAANPSLLAGRGGSTALAWVMGFLFVAANVATRLLARRRGAMVTYRIALPLLFVVAMVGIYAINASLPASI